MDQVDAIVVGAGVVGLAVARALAQGGLDVIVLEREGAIGTGVSSRNSEVIHAGLYYPPGSAKARLCVRGRQMLYAYCAERGIEYRRCGKLVVATQPQDAAKLEAIAQRAKANGLDDLRPLSAGEALEMEPALACKAALHSPSSGIVDSHALMLSLLADAERAGAVLAVHSPLAAASPCAAGWRVETAGAEPFELQATWLVNAAGLGAHEVARRVSGLDHRHLPPQHLAKGHYFSLLGKTPFTRLIYPTPVDGGLGVHLTLDLAGRGRFGPDVEWLPAGTAEGDIDYRVDAGRQAGFEADVRRYWPGLPEGALTPAYSGVRPKISGPGEAAADFLVQGPEMHGCPGLVNLFGIESPGLTSSLALAETVAELVTCRKGST